jgi:threonine/homoserine/homoserine lactone efflux protein
VDLDLPIAIRGLIFGFTIAAAVGPITLLVIRRTIEHGGLYGFASGMGVATADFTYGAVAAFGLTALTTILVSAHTVLAVVGGAIIVYLGIRTAMARPKGPATAEERPGLLGAYASIYALTLANPLTILLFAGFFASLGLPPGSNFGDAAALSVGVGLGSTLWWIVLCTVLGWVRGRLSATVMLWINRISGTAIALFGVLAIASAFQA